MKRLTVSLDDDTIEKLEELAKKDNRSLSEIVRSAIASYYEINTKDAKPEYFEEFVDLMVGREHVAVDVGLWIAMMDELSEKAGDEFWEIVEKVGEEYGLQFREKGYKNIKEILKFFEIGNWFRVNTISDTSYNLILVGRNETKLVKKFLGGLFRILGIEVEMAEGLRKILLKIKK